MLKDLEEITSIRKIKLDCNFGAPSWEIMSKAIERILETPYVDEIVIKFNQVDFHLKRKDILNIEKQVQSGVKSVNLQWVVEEKE